MKSEEYDRHNGPEINLCSAHSPFGPASELANSMLNRNYFTELASYSDDPYSLRINQLIVDGLGLTNIDLEQIYVVSGGSYAAGDEIVRYLSHNGFDEILVPPYSFPNVQTWAKRSCIGYRPFSKGNENPIVPLNQLLRIKGNLKGKIVYLDHPNSTFGVIYFSLLSQLVEHIVANKGVPLVDVVFGEVLGSDYSTIIQDTVDKGGIIIASLSKTQALPGLRTGDGFIISPKSIISRGYDRDQKLEYGVSRQAQLVYETLYKQDGNGDILAKRHALQAAEYNTLVNSQMKNGLEAIGLHMETTDLRTMIQVISSYESGLQQRLLHEGIKTAALNTFDIADSKCTREFTSRAVRMITPRLEQVSEVLNRFRKAIYKGKTWSPILEHSFVK